MNDKEITAIIVFGIICLPALIVPIVAMMIKHQQHMAQVMRSGSGQTADETLALREEVQQLRGLVQQQAIMLDDLQRKSISEMPPRFQERAG